MRLGAPWWLSLVQLFLAQLFHAQAWRRTLLEVVEDFADQVWIGDIGDDAELSASVHLCPSQRGGQRVMSISNTRFSGASHPLRQTSCRLSFLADDPPGSNTICKITDTLHRSRRKH